MSILTLSGRPTVPFLESRRIVFSLDFGVSGNECPPAANHPVRLLRRGVHRRRRCPNRVVVERNRRPSSGRCTGTVCRYRHLRIDRGSSVGSTSRLANSPRQRRRTADALRHFCRYAAMHRSFRHVHAAADIPLEGGDGRVLGLHINRLKLYSTPLPRGRARSLGIRCYKTHEFEPTLVSQML